MSVLIGREERKQIGRAAPADRVFRTNRAKRGNKV